MKRGSGQVIDKHDPNSDSRVLSRNLLKFIFRIAMSLPGWSSVVLVGSPLATLVEREIASGCLPPDHALSKSFGMGLAYGILRRCRNLAVAEAFWLEKSSPGMLPSSPARVVIITKYNIYIAPYSQSALWRCTLFL